MLLEQVKFWIVDSLSMISNMIEFLGEIKG